MDMLQTHQFSFNNFQKTIFVLYIRQTEIHGFRVIFLREKITYINDLLKLERLIYYLTKIKNT